MNPSTKKKKTKLSATTKKAPEPNLDFSEEDLRQLENFPPDSLNFLASRNSEYPTNALEDDEWVHFPFGETPILEPGPPDRFVDPLALIKSAEPPVAPEPTPQRVPSAFRSYLGGSKTPTPTPAPPPVSVAPEKRTTTTPERKAAPVPSKVVPNRNHANNNNNEKPALMNASNHTSLSGIARSEVDELIQASDKDRIDEFISVWQRENGTIGSNAAKRKEATAWAQAQLKQTKQKEHEAWMRGQRPRRTVKKPTSYYEEYADQFEVNDDNHGSSSSGSESEVYSRDGSHNVCAVCRAPGHLYCCCECSLVYHAECLDSPPGDDDDDDWLCPQCVAKQEGRRRKKDAQRSAKSTITSGSSEDEFCIDTDQEQEDQVREQLEHEKWLADSKKHKRQHQEQRKNLAFEIQKLLTPFVPSGGSETAKQPMPVSHRARVLHILNKKDRQLLDQVSAEWKELTPDFPPKLAEDIHKLFKEFLTQMDAEASLHDDDDDDIAFDPSIDAGTQALENLRKAVRSAPNSLPLEKDRIKVVQYLIHYLDMQLLDAEDRDEVSPDFHSLVEDAESILIGEALFLEDIKRIRSLTTAALKGRPPLVQQLLKRVVSELPTMSHDASSGNPSKKKKSKQKQEKEEEVAAEAYDSDELEAPLSTPPPPVSSDTSKKKRKRKRSKERSLGDVSAAMPTLPLAIKANTWKTVLQAQASSRGFAGHVSSLIGEKPAVGMGLQPGQNEAILFYKPKKHIQLEPSVPIPNAKPSWNSVALKPVKATLNQLGGDTAKFRKKYLGWILQKEEANKPIWVKACVLLAHPNKPKQPSVCPVPSKDLALLFPTKTKTEDPVPGLLERAKKKFLDSYNPVTNEFTWICDWKSMRKVKRLTREINPQRESKRVALGTTRVPLLDSRRIYKLLRSKTTYQYLQSQGRLNAKRQEPEAGAEKPEPKDTVPKKRRKNTPAAPVPAKTNKKRDLRCSLGSQYAVNAFPDSGKIAQIPGRSMNGQSNKINWVKGVSGSPREEDVVKLAYDPKIDQKEEVVKTHAEKRKRSPEPVEQPSATTPNPSPKKKAKKNPPKEKESEEKQEQEGPAWIPKKRIDLLQEETSPVPEEPIGEAHESLFLQIVGRRQDETLPPPAWFDAYQKKLTAGKYSKPMALHCFQDVCVENLQETLGPDPLIQACIQGLDREQNRDDLESMVWAVDLLKSDTKVLQEWESLLAKLKAAKPDTQPSILCGHIFQFFTNTGGIHSLASTILLMSLAVRLHRPEGVAPLHLPPTVYYDPTPSEPEHDDKDDVDMAKMAEEFDFFAAAAEPLEPEPEPKSKTNTNNAILDYFKQTQGIRVGLASEGTDIKLQPLSAAVLAVANNKRCAKTWKVALSEFEARYKDRLFTPILQAPPTQRGVALKQALIQWKQECPDAIEPQLFLLAWESMRPDFLPFTCNC